MALLRNIPHIVAHGTPGRHRGHPRGAAGTSGAHERSFAWAHGLARSQGLSRVIPDGAREGAETIIVPMDDHGREPGAAEPTARLDTGPRDHRDAAARARRPGTPPAAPERLGQR